MVREARGVNLLLQHWHGELGELERASMMAMSQYAAEHGAEYELVQGEPLGPGLAVQMHKLHALDARFDTYDVVAMTDMDMFPRVEASESIFNATGLGVMTQTQTTLRANLHSRMPGIADPACDYYGGAVYRLERGIRIRMREHLKRALLPILNARYQDEGVMHILASKLGLRGFVLGDGERWAMSSYDPHIEQAHFIHVRTKVKPEGPKRTKLENLRALRERWLIA